MTDKLIGQPPSVMLQHPCSVALSRILLPLSKSTNPRDVHDLIADAHVRDAGVEPDNRCPEDDPHDTNVWTAESKIGDEHVLGILEHILSACTPVAEAHALLSILTDAGTVPWRTMEPYMKVLLEWHVECGRAPVQSVNLRIPVCPHLATSTSPDT